MVVSASKFLECVEASGLLVGQPLEEARAEAEQSGLDGEALARKLVQSGKLTQYQAKQLLAGRPRGFFIGSYRILESTGRGGMGIVYKAEHTVLRRVVALKVLPPKEAEDTSSVARFQREARAIAQLEHDSIVQVYDIGQQGRVHFIAMEFVPGQKLSHIIRRHERMNPRESARIARQAAEGLEHAFQRGVIHRDVKPSNIIITPEGNVKILDMGLAWVFGELEEANRLSLTVAGAVVGTADYVAPEQAKDSRAADTRSDIYSLGCTLYHCLSGRVPFPNKTFVGKLIAHREEEPVPLEQLFPDIPGKLVAIVRKMMAKRPEDRYQRPAEVAASLASFLEDPEQSIIASPGSTAPDQSTEPPTVVESPVVPESPSAEPASDPVAPSGTTRSANFSATNSEQPLIDADEFLQSIASAVSEVSHVPHSRTLTSNRRLLIKRVLIAGGSVLAAALTGVWVWSGVNYGTLIIELPVILHSDHKVYLDGDRVEFGNRPTKSFRVRPGTHQVEVKPTAGESSIQTVDVPRGGEVVLRSRRFY